MTDDQSFVMTLFGLFWLLPLLIGVGIGRVVKLRTAIFAASSLLGFLLLGAAWAYLGNRDGGYGPEFAIYAYLFLVAGPVFGCGGAGLALGQFWRRKARGGSKWHLMGR